MMMMIMGMMIAIMKVMNMNKKIKTALIQQRFVGLDFIESALDSMDFSTLIESSDFGGENYKQIALKTTFASQLAHIQKAIRKAACNGAKLIILQELCCAHYFCQSENPSNFALSADFSLCVEFFRILSEELKVVIVSSLFEKRAHGLYHNTAVVLDCGRVAGKYRKMHIPDDPQFYEKFYFTPGDSDGFAPIDTSLGRLGVLICWDQWFIEAARIMALKGAEILIYPTAIGWFISDEEDEKCRQREAWQAVMRGHSVANGLPVCAVNRVGFENAFWSDFSDFSPKNILSEYKKADTKDEKGILFWGGSFAYGAQGELLAQAEQGEEILYFEWDKARCEAVRQMWPFLRDRRIDAYSSLLRRFDD